MRFYITLAVIAVLLFLGKIFLFKKPEDSKVPGPSKSEKGKPPTPPVPVDVYVCAAQSFENQLTSSGTIVPTEEVELRPESSGKVIFLKINEGMNVAKGQLLAKIKDDDLKALEKKINLEILLALKQEARQKKLLEINAISKEEYDLTNSKVNTLQADLELNKIYQSKTIITAPFSGKISFKNISLGAYITPASVIATLVQTNPINIDFSIPEKYSNEVRVGSYVNFITEEGSKYNAKVQAFDSKIDANLRTLKIRAISANPGTSLIPGMFVKVELKLASKNSIMVPTQAIIPILKGKKVYVVKNGKAEERKVETGTRTDQKVQILSGLSSGDSLIISGLMAIKPESLVKIKKAKP